jgi:dihydrolipoamide dehydrogenase
MQSRKAEVVKKLNSGVEFLMRANKVEVVIGTAELITKNSLKVNNETIEFKNLIIATGSVPSMLPLPGFQDGFTKGQVIDSTGALSLPKIPKTFSVIGGGVIGIEFAVLYAELGSKVTIIQGLDRILERLDMEVSQEVSKILQSKGVEIITNAKIIEYNTKNSSVVVEVDGVKKEVKSDYTLMSVGRKPVNIGADKIGVKLSERGFIQIDENCQTNVPNIYAIGDCASTTMLAHVAYKHSAIAISKITNKGYNSKVDFNKIPGCIYSYPEIATIGRTEEELKASQTPYLKVKLPMKVIGKAIADGDEGFGFIKLLFEPKYGEVLGCHIVGSTASDMISELALLMELEGTVYELANAVHPHPSISEIIQEAAIEATHKLGKH